MISKTVIERAQERLRAAQENVKQEEENVQGLRRRVIEGETTGDLVGDIVFSYPRGTTPEFEQALRDFYAKFEGKPGEYFLARGEHLHVGATTYRDCCGGVHTSQGIMPEILGIDYSHDSKLCVGVLNGSVGVDLTDRAILFPCSRHVEFFSSTNSGDSMMGGRFVSFASLSSARKSVVEGGARIPLPYVLGLGAEISRDTELSGQHYALDVVLGKADVEAALEETFPGRQIFGEVLSLLEI